MLTVSPREWRSVTAVLLLILLVGVLDTLRRHENSILRPLNLDQNALDVLALIESEESKDPEIDEGEEVLHVVEYAAHSALETNEATVESTTPRVEVPPASATVPSCAANPTGPITKAVVMGALAKEDTSWVTRELPDWQHAIYRVDLPDDETSPTGLRTSINKGRESMPYLTYIIDHYDVLPEVMAFIHPHRNGWPAAWHNDAADYDAVAMLQSLQIHNVACKGYVNLRCMFTPGCPAELKPWREPPDLERTSEHAFPYFYSVFFDKTLEETRREVEVVATPCCAQFAVSRAQVQARPRSEYAKYRALIEVTKYDDYTSGRVMEYMWHILFGQEAVFCPDPASCFCDVYGRC